MSMIVKTKTSNKRKSRAKALKMKNSNYWREQSLSSKAIMEQANKLIEREDIRVMRLSSTTESKSSFSTIINSKGVIIID